VLAACEIARTGKGKLRLGNIYSSRDWGWAPEYVEAMWRMLQLDKPEDFVIATGESNTLGSFCNAVFEELGKDLSPFVEVDKSLFRPSDIEYGRGDPTKAERQLSWAPKYHMRDVVRAMVAAELAGNALPGANAPPGAMG
jgi:GDPmannose 4,6-dehydratase